MNKLGELIRAGRKAKGISQETLGKLVDDHRQNILNLEAGRLKPGDDLLERISKVIEEPYPRLIALKILDHTSDDVKKWLLTELQSESPQF